MKVGDARPVLPCGDRALALGTRTFVMGVLNVTPDSFSDGGRHLAVDAALAHARALLADGADVLDVGGESTRPGAAPVGEDEELARVVPVIERLAAEGVAAISVDTRRATVARAARAAGARWLNDVDALAGPGMLEVAASFDVVCLMHWRRAGHDAREDHVGYDDVVADVASFLDERVAAAEAAGVAPGRVLVDPGIGFGKRVEDNLALTRHLDAVRGRAAGVLYGPSRKRFLGALTGEQDPARRDAATVGAVCFAAQRGADVVRVHDVRGCRQALLVVDALAGRGTSPG